MPIFRTQNSGNAPALEDYPTSIFQELGATAGQTLSDSPSLGVLRTAGEGLDTLMRDVRNVMPEFLRGMDLGPLSPEQLTSMVIGPPDEMLTAQEAKDKAAARGLDIPYKEGSTYPESYTNALEKRRIEEQARQSIISRGPQGKIPWALNQVVGTGVSLLDPLNDYAFSLPFGEAAVEAAKAATFFKTAGVLSKPIAKAVSTGVLGSTALAPIEAANMSQQQKDYDIGTWATQALYTGAGGAFLGTLHMGAGQFADFIGKRVKAEVQAKVAEGKAPPEIAAEMGKTEAEVKDILAQPESAPPTVAERFESMPLDLQDKTHEIAFKQLELGNDPVLAVKAMELSQNANDPTNTQPEMRHDQMHMIPADRTHEFFNLAHEASTGPSSQRGLDLAAYADYKTRMETLIGKKDVTPEIAAEEASNAERQVNVAAERIAPAQVDALRSAGTEVKATVEKDAKGKETTKYSIEYPAHDEAIAASKALPDIFQKLINCLGGK